MAEVFDLNETCFIPQQNTLKNRTVELYVQYAERVLVVYSLCCTGGHTTQREKKGKKEEIVHLYALALHIYNNFDLCLSIDLFFMYKVW